MSRPYRFSPLAPNKGLSIGTGIINGLNQGLQNMAKMKMQKAQMQAHQAQAEAMKTYRQAQAEQMRQKSMGSSMSDVRLMQALVKGEHMDPAVLRPLIKDKIDTFLETAKPEEKNAMAAHIEKQIQAGDVPAEIQPYMNFSANQLRTFDRMGSNVTKENVAGTQAGAKVDAANIYGDTRENVARIGAAAHVEGAKIGAGSRGGNINRADLQAMKDLAGQMKQVQGLDANLDKPVPLGATPLDPAVKEATRKAYKEQLLDLHKQYDGIHSRLSPEAAAGGVPAGNQEAAPKQPRYLKDTNGAQPGDFVQGNGGFYKVGPSGKGYEAGPNGTPAVFPGQGAQGAPQAAPAAPAVPKPQMMAAPPAAAPGAVQPPPMMSPAGGLQIEPIE